MASTSQQYCLRWNNHRSNLLTVFDELLQNESFTDVTLAVDGGASVKCHKMVLAACSSYFQTLFIDLPCKHPIVVLKDVKYSEIKAILEYMYRGEVNVAQEQLAGLLKVAEVLKVKGLVEENGSQSRREEVETSMSPPPAITTSTTSSAAHSSGLASPPHSTGTSYVYGRSPVDRTNQMPLPMWPLSGLPISHSSSNYQTTSHPQHSSTLTGSYDNGFETSPLKRKKLSNILMNRDTPILRTVLGQGHADSSQGIPLLHPDSHENHFRNNSNGSSNDNDRRSSTDIPHGEPAHSPYTDVSMMDEDDKQPSPQSYPPDKPGIVNYVPAQKPEWKRYKQYTRKDIMSAIEAVRTGMSALQAARKYGVPSRTLYDKVKKLGITTSRPFKRGSNGSGACFPYGIGGNANGGIYSGALSENENENSSAIDSPGSILDAYKARDGPMDRDMLDVTRCSSTPIIHSVKQQSNEDQVEDLSVTRKSDVRVIVPPTSVVKNEEDVD
ncbi:uncharacterized protein LOC117606825 [Osmia lignaria lignaria]|uniref:uncharacterized protein LOC117606825 n=1 Tax=Osmia lignaria lignaria TaxID=1437193 RepID=UPI001478B7A2|nr:protein tramtrack, beta isoform-like [Osmia lignaria]XP_034185674.1 protein tramtrack, beta isoform-like [Osmia lignaria]XP_034185675.1 protein tramtrack, beta isoform-like [Osmia lignaria]XP_034185676.1 protein tramtrack, beta isoform-like [Osmia lignaria]XP_034185677.1 protein tramtrack, beta isoform-like [Osmia lignaria]XP_034185678.1 protein tramtrack, beta isoform-like [Osmia lignaria]XP_034185679.1 protein tramtrack, beta isoform-like [Osmia lignaria]XP_034185680.1 protein tramtrack